MAVTWRSVSAGGKKTFSVWRTSGIARVRFGITGTDPEEALISGGSLVVAGTSILPAGAEQFVVAKLKLD